MLTASAASAQNLQSGYFDDNYMYRFQSNPALATDAKFFLGIGVGNLNLGLNSNIGLENFLYNVGGKTVTCLHPDVPAAKVLESMPDRMRFDLNLRENIFALGFKGMGGFNTFSASVRTDVAIGLPKDVIRMAKDGITNTTYDLSPLGGQGAAWAEMSLGHSHQIGNLRIGANLKFLMGAASFYTDVRAANIHLRENEYVAEVDAEVHASVAGLKYTTSYNEDTKNYYVDNVELENFSPNNGYGLAADLGVAYTVADIFEFSAAVTDLGGIKWNNDVVASTGGLQQVSTDQIHFGVESNDSFDNFTEDAAKLFELKNEGDRGARFSGIGTGVNGGVLIKMPFYKRLKVGALYTSRINDAYSWQDYRVSATIEPVSWFSLSANVGTGTFGPRVGGLFNIKAPGFNLFIGSDNIPCKFSKQWIPLSPTANINLGWNMTF